jgi:hypothetical protein
VSGTGKLIRAIFFLSLRESLGEPDTGVWTVRDSRDRLFGFALTRQHPRHIELALICAVKRKGETTTGPPARWPRSWCGTRARGDPLRLFFLWEQ